MINKEALVKRARYLKVPITELQNPKKIGFLRTIRDHWWVVNEQEEAFFYQPSERVVITYAHPQCNVDEEITRYILKNCELSEPNLNVIKLDWVWLPTNSMDYAEI